MKRNIFLLSIITLFAMHIQAEPPIEEGKALFNSRCATCHNVNKTVVGPALAGIDERRSLEWIVKFVQSSQTLIKKGDADASEVFAKFNSFPMPDHPDLTADNIEDIVSYIKSQSRVVEETKEPFTRPGKLRPAYIPVKRDNYLFFGGLFLGISLLVFSLLMLVRVKEIQRTQ